MKFQRFPLVFLTVLVITPKAKGLSVVDTPIAKDVSHKYTFMD